MIISRHSYLICVQSIGLFFHHPRGLGKCTIGEEEFPLKKHNKQVDGIIDRAQTHGDHLFVLLQKLMDHRVVCVSITRLLLISSLFKRHGLCSISRISYRYSRWREIHHCLWHTERLLANTNSKEGLSQNCICNFKRQNSLWSSSVRHRQCTLGIPTCDVPRVRQFWPTEWLVGVYGWCHRVSCNVGSSPQIIRGYILSTSSSRPGIKTIQNRLWTEGSPLSWGHVLSANGVHMDKDRIEAIIDLKTPTTMK